MFCRPVSSMSTEVMVSIGLAETRPGALMRDPVTVMASGADSGAAAADWGAFAGPAAAAAVWIETGAVALGAAVWAEATFEYAIAKTAAAEPVSNRRLRKEARCLDNVKFMCIPPDN